MKTLTSIGRLCILGALPLVLVSCSIGQGYFSLESSQEDIESGEYRVLDGKECPPRFDAGLFDNREVADWALGKIYDASSSEGWWCLINDDLYVSADDDSVWIRVVTAWDARSAEAIKLSYEICSAFLRPFSESGSIDFGLNGHLLEGNVRVDGVVEYKLNENSRFVDGLVIRGEPVCGANSYFESVSKELVESGWTLGKAALGRGSFNESLSGREDFYCRGSECN